MRRENHALGGVLLASLAAVTLLAPTAQAADGVLCRDGRAVLPIIAGSVPEPVEELGRTLEAITGTRFPEAEPRQGAAGIYVGLADDFPWLDFEETEGLGPEGFVLKSDATGVYLLAGNPAGVEHAVTTFLHRLGCRWFFPGDVWEVVPRESTISGSWNEVQKPSFPQQRRIWYGFGAYPRCREDKEAWNHHNRMGGPVPITIGHTWHGLDPERDLGEHPEWFALTDGERKPTKPCYSHPDVRKLAVEHALEEAARGKRVISMSPPDGLGYCECDRCRSVFRGGEAFRDHGTLFARRPDGVLVNITSETLFDTVNEVAAAVAKRYPEAFIGCYAYSAYCHPPSFDLHPNVLVQTTTAFQRTPLSTAELIAAYGRKARSVGVREYYSVYQWDWDGPAVAKGSLFLPRLVHDLRSFHASGVTAINAEASNNWGPRGLGYYVAANLLWDVDVDVIELLRDFYRKAFGPAALPMERYYVRWYGPCAAVTPGVAPDGPLADGTPDPEDPALAVKAGLDREALRASYRDLEEAAARVAGTPGCRERVDRLRLYLVYLTLRLRLEDAAQADDRDGVIRAIREETTLAARLTNTHLVHSRALLGKAFHRRFRAYARFIEPSGDAADLSRWALDIRKPRDDIPTRGELEDLWEEAGQTLAGRGEP